jgi:hypothetical protein
VSDALLLLSFHLRILIDANGLCCPASKKSLDKDVGVVDEGVDDEGLDVKPMLLKKRGAEGM